MKYKGIAALSLIMMLVVSGISIHTADLNGYKGSPQYGEAIERTSRVSPSANIVSPSNGQSFLTTDTIVLDGTGSVADSEGDLEWYYSDAGVFIPMPGFNLFTIGTGTTASVLASAIGPGDWKIWLIAYGTVNGNSTQDEASVSIHIDLDYAPVPVISSPGDGDMFLTTDSIQFDASGSYDQNGQTLSYNWTSSKDGPLSQQKSFSRQLSAGTHTITLSVSDGANDPVSTSITIDVYEPNKAPTIEIHEPDGINDQADTSYTITWTATDEDGPANTLTITLYYDTDGQPGGETMIATSVANTGSYEWDCSNVPDGDYFIYAKVEDHPSLYVHQSLTGEGWSPGKVTISHNKPPSLPENIHVDDDHSLQPTIVWDESLDPEGKAVKYYISIGTSEYGRHDIVDEKEVLDSEYTVPVTLSFGDNGLRNTYYGELYAKDGDGMKTDPVEFSFTLKNQAPSELKAKITPEKPLTTDDLTVEITDDSVDPDRDTVTYIYQWYVDGYEFTEVDGPTVPYDATEKGEEWKCVITPFDGYAYGPSYEVKVKIQNSPPEPMIVSPKDGQEFYADPTTFELPEIEFDARMSSDADGDTLSMQWDFGDGDTDAGSYTTHTYEDAGDYKVSLMVSDGDTVVFKEITIHIYVPVLEVAEVTIIAENNITMEGKTATISALIKNTGEADSKSIPVEFYVDNSKIGSTTASVKAKSTKEVKMEWTPSSKGTHKVKVLLPDIEDSDVTIDVKVQENPELHTNDQQPSTNEDNTGETEKSTADQIKETVMQPTFIAGIVILLIVLIVVFFAVKISRINRQKREEQKRKYEEKQLQKKREMEERRRQAILAQQAAAAQAAALAKAKQAELMKPVVEHTLKEMEIKKKPPIVIVKKEKPQEIAPGVKKIGEKLVQEVTCQLCGNTFQVDYGEHEAACPYCGEMNMVTVAGGEIKKVKTEENNLPSIPVAGTPGVESPTESLQSAGRDVTCSLCGKHFTAEEGAAVAVCPYCGEENKL